MTDLHARETQDEDQDGPVVELVEEDQVVGIVYYDEGTTLAEFYANVGGDAWAFDVADLQRVLDTARAIVDPDSTFVLEGPSAAAADDHPVDELAARFDSAAAFRGEEDEGFYPPDITAAIVEACSEYDLAVVSLEGMTLKGDGLAPLPGHSADVGATHAGEDWPVFRAGCNVHAEAVLQRWGLRDRLVVAVEVVDRDGETYVL